MTAISFVGLFALFWRDWAIWCADDPEVQKLRRKIEHGDKMKHVPVFVSGHGDGSARDEALKLRIEEKGCYSLATSPTPKETFLYVNAASSLSRSFSAF